MGDVATALENPAPDVRLLPVDRVFVVSNTRKRFPSIDELKASIAKHGILQPLRVHDAGEPGFRLIFGECRLRAARELGLTHVPALVVTATEEQILEEQLVENGQRKDIHAMEEAEAFALLRDKHTKSVEEIALRVGKSRSHVLARLKLCDLAENIRTAFYDDKLTIRAAYALARIPSPELQRQAFADIRRPRPCAWTDAEVERHIRERYMLSLDNAPFDRKDVNLIPAAGACGACAKRTGNARDLFGDIKEKDVCTDPACFQAKTRATWTQRCEEALARGWEVLDEGDSHNLYPHGGYLGANSPYVDLDTINYQDTKRRTWRQLLSRAPVQVILAKDTFDKPHYLVRRDEANLALADRGYTFASLAPQSARSEDQNRAQQREQRKKTAEKAAVARAAIAAVVDKASSQPADEAFWRLLLTGLARGSWHEVIQGVVKRRAWAEKGQRPEEQLLARLPTLTLDELRGLALELVIGRGANWAHAADYGDSLKAACSTYGVNLQQIALDLHATKDQPSNPSVAATEPVAVPT